ncbi:hippocampus abundant transcript 1 protein [Rhinoderma darwinii]|uniref:hippocampus abundant transcript 1 protein n=1 Tax=Rhinoderma darwinii TaxID=43563 RepID=UPI003F67C358
MTQGKKKKRVNRSVLLAKKIIIKDGGSPQGFGSPSVYHAVIVIFLEFFAWGLLTAPTLVVLHETFPKHTFLMNGLIQGVKVKYELNCGTCDLFSDYPCSSVLEFAV